MRLVNGELWCCQNDGRILVLDQHLTQKYWLEHRSWGDVYDVTQLWNQEVVLTGSDGLFHLSAEGKILQVITRDLSYCQCVVINSTVYACGRRACCRLFKSFVFSNLNGWRCQIIKKIGLSCFHQETDTLQNQIRQSRLLLSNNGRDDMYEMRSSRILVHDNQRRDDMSLVASASDLLLCFADSKEVMILSKTGDVKSTCCVKGDFEIGPISNPRICGVDAEGSILVLDDVMSALHVRDVTGSWRQLRLDFDRPAKFNTLNDALLHNGALYLICDDRRVLTLFTAS